MRAQPPWCSGQAKFCQIGSDLGTSVRAAAWGGEKPTDFSRHNDHNYRSKLKQLWQDGKGSCNESFFQLIATPASTCMASAWVVCCRSFTLGQHVIQHHRSHARLGELEFRHSTGWAWVSWKAIDFVWQPSGTNTLFDHVITFSVVGRSAKVTRKFLCCNCCDAHQNKTLPSQGKYEVMCSKIKTKVY